jgi:cytosine permease
MKMSESKNVPNTNEEAYEYAFEKVPENKRKSLLNLVFVLAGYPIALTNFFIGGSIGAGLPFPQAVLALLLGNAVLIAIVILTGTVAFRTGLSTTFLSKRAFGKSGSYIFSFLVALSAVTWVALNGDLFSRMIQATFSWWPIPLSITAVICIAMWLISSVRGMKGLTVVSYLGVPAALLLSIYAIYRVGEESGGFSGVFGYVPQAPMSFTAATAAVVGSFAFGATITPDVCRFAKKQGHVVIAGTLAFLVGCFGLQFAGVFIASSTGILDFMDAMVSIGLAVLAFFTAIFCLWTTQDNNIYGASLALQNIIKDTKYYGKIKHKHIAIVIAGIAAIFAAGGIFSYIIPIVTFLSILIPAVPGIIVTQEFFIKEQNTDLFLNKNAIFSWIIGAIGSYISLKMNFFIAPVTGFILGSLSYLLIYKITYVKTVPSESKRKNIV